MTDHADNQADDHSRVVGQRRAPGINDTIRLDAAIVKGSLSLPSRFGRYQVLERMGAGGFASVYAAYDPELESEVAVKVLAENHSANTLVRRRFVAEARVARRLGNDRLIGVFDLGETDDGRPYVVMELARRGTLRQRLVRTGRPGRDDLIRLIDELGACMAAIHAKGVVHRDIKPSNLLFRVRGERGGEPARLIEDDEQLVLADFGLARDISDGVSSATIGGGTEGYMAPEQAHTDGKADTRADIYAATVVVAELTTGRHPQRLDLATADITTPMLEVLTRSLAVDREQRPATADDWRRALREAYADDLRPGAPVTVDEDATTAHQERTRVEMGGPDATAVQTILPDEATAPGPETDGDAAAASGPDRSAAAAAAAGVDTPPPPPPALPLTGDRPPPPGPALDPDRQALEERARLRAARAQAEAEEREARREAAAREARRAERAARRDQGRPPSRPEPTDGARSRAPAADRAPGPGASGPGTGAEPARRGPTVPASGAPVGHGPAGPTPAEAADRTRAPERPPSPAPLDPPAPPLRPTGAPGDRPPDRPVRPAQVAQPATGGPSAPAVVPVAPRPFTGRPGPVGPAPTAPGPGPTGVPIRPTAAVPVPTPRQHPVPANVGGAPVDPTSEATRRSRDHLRTAARLAKLERKEQRKRARQARRRRRRLRVANFFLALIRGMLAALVMAVVASIVAQALVPDLDANEGAQGLVLLAIVGAFLWGLSYFPFPRSFDV